MAPRKQKMAATLTSFFKRAPSKSSSSEFDTAPEGQLFEKTKPEEDGDECLHDCESCTIKYPNKFSIDEKEKLYGHVKGWQTHLLVATGKTDWVRDVEDEKGSVMQAIGKTSAPENGVGVVDSSLLSSVILHIECMIDSNIARFPETSRFRFRAGAGALNTTTHHLLMSSQWHTSCSLAPRRGSGIFNTALVLKRRVVWFKSARFGPNRKLPIFSGNRVVVYDKLSSVFSSLHGFNIPVNMYND